MQDLFGAISQANAANEQRYNQVLGGYGNLISSFRQQKGSILGGYKRQRERVMGYLGNLGASQRLSLNENYARYLGDMQQSMLNRGLYNSSAFNSASRGAAYDKAKANVTLEDALTREYATWDTSLDTARLAAQERLAGVDAGLVNSQLGFMERRTDAAPDPGLYGQLARAAGVPAGVGGFTSNPSSGPRMTPSGFPSGTSIYGSDPNNFNGYLGTNAFGQQPNPAYAEAQGQAVAASSSIANLVSALGGGGGFSSLGGLAGLAGLGGYTAPGAGNAAYETPPAWVDPFLSAYGGAGGPSMWDYLAAPYGGGPTSSISGYSSMWDAMAAPYGGGPTSGVGGAFLGGYTGSVKGDF